MTQGIVDFNDWQKIELRVGKIIEVLAACTDDESKVILVTPEKDIEAGSRIY